jgi:hypothetical protein
MFKYDSTEQELNIILEGAVMIAATTVVMAGVQTGVIASQTFHGEEGGVIPAGGTSGDNTILHVNKGGALLKGVNCEKL